jgi:hypothetical protein
MQQIRCTSVPVLPGEVRWGGKQGDFHMQQNCCTHWNLEIHTQMSGGLISKRAPRPGFPAAEPDAELKKGGICRVKE